MFISHSCFVTDKLKWAITDNGQFTTKFAYDHITSTTKCNTTVEKDFNWVWKLSCPNKLRYFIWLCHHDRLPTKHYLYHIGINIDTLCSICHQSINTVSWNANIFKKSGLRITYPSYELRLPMSTMMTGWEAYGTLGTLRLEILQVERMCFPSLFGIYGSTVMRISLIK